MLEIIKWLANGKTGISSKAMAFTALGVKYKDARYYPYDPADFNRCLLLLEVAPIVRESFPKIRELSPEWAAIIDHWDELERLFLDEVGRDWSKAQRAPKTYERMLQLRANNEKRAFE